MPQQVYIIIVTHNSADELDTCIGHLERQTVPIKKVTIVDCGSIDTGYLDNLTYNFTDIKIYKKENIGFSKANNFGFRESVSDQSGIVIFLNPDTFLPHDFLAQAVNIFNENPHAAVISGKLIGYDLQQIKPSGIIDSTGVFQNWYGRWYDRGQGQKDYGQFDLIDSPPALCGALLCCRVKALAQFHGEIFDPEFFLYKEDIEFCLRVRKTGWSLVYDPRLLGYHCRGWNNNRKKMSYRLRLTAAKSELLLHKKHICRGLIWAYLKFIAVRVLHI